MLQSWAGSSAWWGSISGGRSPTSLLSCLGGLSLFQHIDLGTSVSCHCRHSQLKPRGPSYLLLSDKGPGPWRVCMILPHCAWVFLQEGVSMLCEVFCRIQTVKFVTGTQSKTKIHWTRNVIEALCKHHQWHLHDKGPQAQWQDMKTSLHWAISLNPVRETTSEKHTFG